MKVRATQVGYYGNVRRRVGDIFDLVPVKGLNGKREKVTFTPEQQFSEKWMEKVGAAQPGAKTQEQKPKSSLLPPGTPGAQRHDQPAALKEGDESDTGGTGDANVI